MQNASRHARADKIEIRLFDDDTHVGFTVSDDGIGFEVETYTGHGLTNMADRLGAIGGSLEVHSRSDGTDVNGTVPLRP